MNFIGYSWLSNRYKVSIAQDYPVKSSVGKARATHNKNTLREEIYPEGYRPDPDLRGHLTFAFRYEGVNLEFLSRLFSQQIVSTELREWIAAEPTGTYARRAGFLYEWLTEQPLASANTVFGNYVDALDPNVQVVGTSTNNVRWRVRDNLPGSRAFCPTVRRTSAIRITENIDLPGNIKNLESDFGADLLMRSAVWLTIKESRASFQIEQEQHQQDRIRRFATVMDREIGKHTNPLSREALEVIQRGILGDSALRYGFRQSPVYVGHTSAYEPIVDYIAPDSENVEAMLAGLSEFLNRTPSVHSIIRAAVASFAFVYIHPLADGNGRISRFLVNDILRRDGVVPPPLVLPISATIADSAYARADYDRVLEIFSRPFMQLYGTDYRFGELKTAPDGVQYNLQFDRYADATHAWQYPDLTEHVAYMAGIIEMTLQREMRKEASLLLANDRARQAIKAFLEAPNNELDSIIRSVQQSGYTVSNQLLKRFPQLAQQPHLQANIVQAVRDAFASD